MNVKTSTSYVQLNGMPLDEAERFIVVINSVTIPDPLGEYEQSDGFIRDTRWPAPNGLGKENYPFGLKIKVDGFHNALYKIAVHGDLNKILQEGRGALLAEEIRQAAMKQGIDLNLPGNAFLLAVKLPSGNWNIKSSPALQRILTLAGTDPLGEHYVVSADPKYGLLKIRQGQLVAAF